jgi:hypothetical protein
VKPLYRFFNRLPQYTKQTKNISQTASAIKDTLFSSKDPDVLLFHQLPRACGVEPFSAKKAVVPDQLSAFFTSLKGALLELQRVYDDLLIELQSILFKAFGLTETGARERLEARARSLIVFCVDPRLRAFTHQVQEVHESESAWIEAISTIVVGKEPRLWNDPDRTRYEVVITDLVRSFRHLEVVVFEEARRLEQGRKPEHILRISVGDRYSKDMEAVVVVEPQDSSMFSTAVVELDELMHRLDLTSNPELALAALSSISQKYLSELLDSNLEHSAIPVTPAREKVKHGK